MSENPKPFWVIMMLSRKVFFKHSERLSCYLEWLSCFLHELICCSFSLAFRSVFVPLRIHMYATVYGHNAPAPLGPIFDELFKAGSGLGNLSFRLSDCRSHFIFWGPLALARALRWTFTLGSVTSCSRPWCTHGGGASILNQIAFRFNDASIERISWSGRWCIGYSKKRCRRRKKKVSWTKPSRCSIAEHLKQLRMIQLRECVEETKGHADIDLKLVATWTLSRIWTHILVFRSVEVSPPVSLHTAILLYLLTNMSLGFSTTVNARTGIFFLCRSQALQFMFESFRSNQRIRPLQNFCAIFPSDGDADVSSASIYKLLRRLRLVVSSGVEIAFFGFGLCCGASANWQLTRKLCACVYFSKRQWWINCVSLQSLHGDF